MKPEDIDKNPLDADEWNDLLVDKKEEEPERDETAEVSCEFLTGQAGTGKTFQMKERVKESDGTMVLAATTGIAAVNLGDGVTTINSLLKYFDTESLNEKWIDGGLYRLLKRLYDEEDLRHIVIDEVSMMDAKQVDIIYGALLEQAKDGRDIGITLTGDFCQLPPVKAKWAFQSKEWHHFADNTTRLTKVWRQSSGPFLEALNCFRRGDGRRGAEMMKGIATFRPEPIQDYSGTTIIPKNEEVDLFNKLRLSKLEGTPFTLKTFRWCAPGRNEILKQWNSVPDSTDYKEGALIMILSNDTENWTYVNGDQAILRKYDADSRRIILTNLRNDREISLPILTRRHTQKEIPPEYKDKKESDWPKSRQEANELTKGANLTYYSLGDKYNKPKWIVGEIIYYPIRLAYASTVHKTQGLTLENVQVDLRHSFFGAPAMVYVALSRCKSPEGLTIVGSPSLLSQRCKIDPIIRRWL